MDFHTIFGALKVKKSFKEKNPYHFETLACSYINFKENKVSIYKLRNQLF